MFDYGNGYFLGSSIFLNIVFFIFLIFVFVNKKYNKISYLSFIKIIYIVMIIGELTNFMINGVFKPDKSKIKSLFPFFFCSTIYFFLYGYLYSKNKIIHTVSKNMVIVIEFIVFISLLLFPSAIVFKSNPFQNLWGWIYHFLMILMLLVLIFYENTKVEKMCLWQTIVVWIFIIMLDASFSYILKYDYCGVIYNNPITKNLFPYIKPGQTKPSWVFSLNFFLASCAIYTTLGILLGIFVTFLFKLKSNLLFKKH